MISEVIPVFPNNAVDIIATRALELIDPPDLYVVKRPLRKSDPNETLGVYAAFWNPVEDSYEMRGGNPTSSEPTLQRYMVFLEAFIKDMDEERGLAKHSVFSKLVRAMLYRDAPLLVSLRTLSSTVNGSTERTQRLGIRTQRYSSNELDGAFLFLSVIEFWLETETV